LLCSSVSSRFFSVPFSSLKEDGHLLNLQFAKVGVFGKSNYEFKNANESGITGMQLSTAFLSLQSLQHAICINVRSPACGSVYSDGHALTFR
jgi:hypothetical protein